MLMDQKEKDFPEARDEGFPFPLSPNAAFFPYTPILLFFFFLLDGFVKAGSFLRLDHGGFFFEISDSAMRIFSLLSFRIRWMRTD